ncbi:MAG: hypothetical protein R2800_12355 [Flavipsychrobacter sp.]
MREKLKAIYRFLPVQLLLLHFRKYQLLLVFWVALFSIITGGLASSFGAATIFLTPEYLGETSFLSMALMGGAVGVFIMAWHITTFIIHSHRIPFMGAIRYSFIKYCINNSFLPLSFLIAYSVIGIRFLIKNEEASFSDILIYQLGFYLGLAIIIIISFAYFFRVSRDLLKTVLSRFTNPGRIKEIIPYDSLDYEMDIIRADSFLSGGLAIKKLAEVERYHPRLLNTVLRKHHRNAITATIFAITTLLLFGIFMENPKFRVPASASFLLLFSIIMGMVGSMKYFLRSWEVLGWIMITVLISLMVKQGMFDLRSRAYGLDYTTKTEAIPTYNYNSLKKAFSTEKYEQDRNKEFNRLNNWKANGAKKDKRTLVVISVSGGGSRSAYWTFKTLQHIDSLSRGQLFNNTVLLTGASGGMIGAAYWRELHSAYIAGKINSVYNTRYQDNIGSDLLNAIVFSFASVDLISPFNKISLAGYSYTKDRGYAMEQEMIHNTEGVLDTKLGNYKTNEAKGLIPMMIVNGTIINDGRKLMMGAQPISYLTHSEHAHKNSKNPPIDAVDFATFFQNRNPYNLRLTSALRMNATFPLILPVVKLPSEPRMNIMDIGLRDNFGVELISRYLYTMRDWINENVDNVVYLQIRDTKDYEIFPPSSMKTLGSMIIDPVFAIQNKWEPFQSYQQEYVKDYAPNFLKSKLHYVTLQYIPEKKSNMAALNFHLTTRERKDILNSINHPNNQKAVDDILKLLQ